MSKFLRITAIVLLILSLLVFGAFQFLKRGIIKDYLDAEISAALNDIWDADVQFTMGEIILNLATKTISLEDFDVYITKDSDSLGEICIPRIDISWKSTYALIFSEENHIRSVILHDVYCKYTSSLTYKEKTKTEPFALVIDHFEVQNGVLDLYEEPCEQLGRLQTSVDMQVLNIHLDSKKDFDLMRDVIQASSGKFYGVIYTLQDGFHEMTVDDIFFHPEKNTALISGFSFAPLFDRETFAKKRGEETDHLTFDADTIRILGCNFFANETLLINTIEVKGADFRAHRDKNYILPNDRFVAILVDRLEHNETIPIHIHTVVVKDMTLTYTELPEDGSTYGKVFFSNLGGTIENISNISDSISKKNPAMVIKAKARLYGKGTLTATIAYTLQSKNGHFTAKGSLSPMDLLPLNDAIIPLSPLSVESGKSNGLSFYLSGDRMRSKGELRFRYEDLKLSVEKRDRGTKLERYIKNTLANLVVPSNNPLNNGRYRIGLIEYERDTRRSMFHYWWKSLETGFRSALGEQSAKSIERIEK